MREKMKNLHFEINVSFNEEEYSWQEPSSSKHISFTIPLLMFEPKKLTDVIAQLAKDVEVAFPDAQIEYNRQRAEDARKKADAEAARLQEIENP